MARLKLLKGAAKWTEFPLESAEEVIGRDPRQASVVLSDPSHTISRSHASIVRESDRYFIQDHSKSGTSLNGRRLVPEKRYPLEGECLIQMCHHVLVFLEDVTEIADPPVTVRIDDDGSSELSDFLDLSSSGKSGWTVTNAESKLAAIMELTRNLRPCSSLDSLLDTALNTLLQLFSQADHGVALILDSGSQRPRMTASRNRSGDANETSVISATVVKEISAKRAAALSDDRHMICAPLISEDEQPQGVIFLEGRGADGRFREDDLDIFATIAVELAIAVENRLLNEAALKARELQHELKIANEVQIGLLPASAPRRKAYEFFDYYSPARQVGGDYFDYIDLEQRRLAIVLGDVSGKGVPAALLMSKVANELNILLTGGVEPTEAIQRVNTRLASRNPRGAFVTMLLAVLDQTRHEVTLVNAGHCYPLLRRENGDVVEVAQQQSGFPLGVVPEQQYAEMVVSMRPGEALVLYSDGIVDAQNEDGVHYGQSRLQSLLAGSSVSSRTLGEQIIKDIQGFVGDAEQFDDICLLCVGRRSSDAHLPT